MGKVPDYECDACGQSTSGYSRADLEGSGWVWHIVQKRTNMRTTAVAFVCCWDCELMYAERRKAKAAKA